MSKATTYGEQLVREIEQTPEEYLPNLIEIVRQFRASVALKPAQESFRQGWREALAGETWPVSNLSVERHSTVQGGDACIARTRIPVWVLAAMHKQGDTVDDLLEAYPNLTAAEVHAALSYYYDHRAEIDSVIAVQNARHKEIRGE